MLMVDAYRFNRMRAYRRDDNLTHFVSFIQANIELAATYACLILADDGVDITVSFLPSSPGKHA